MLWMCLRTVSAALRIGSSQLCVAQKYHWSQLKNSGDIVKTDVLSLAHALFDPPSTNYNLNHCSPDLYSLVPDNGFVLDIGSRGTEASYSFSSDRLTKRGIRLIGFDIEFIEGVALIADACAVPIKDDSIDYVLCISVLEYVPIPQQAINEALRVLKPGGYIYLSTPFVFPFHPPPTDLFRFSPDGLRILAKGFQAIQIGSNRGPASTFCHLLAHFLAITFCFNSKRVHGFLLDFFKWMVFWIKYLDRFIGNYEVAKHLYGNAFFFGRKPMKLENDR